MRRLIIGICYCPPMASKDDIIAEPRGIVAAQAKRIAARAKRIDTLTNRIADLELKLAKAQKNSSNSSKSPSSDITNPPAKKNKVSGKRKKAKRGGQKGHKRKLRKPIPPERVDEQINRQIPDRRTGRRQSLRHVTGLFSVHVRVGC